MSPYQLPGPQVLKGRRGVVMGTIARSGSATKVECAEHDL